MHDVKWKNGPLDSRVFCYRYVESSRAMKTECLIGCYQNGMIPSRSKIVWLHPFCPVCSNPNRPESGILGNIFPLIWYAFAINKCAFLFMLSTYVCHVYFKRVQPKSSSESSSITLATITLRFSAVGVLLWNYRLCARISNRKRCPSITIYRARFHHNT